MTIFDSLTIRTSVGIVSAATLLVCGSASADTRSACIAACDAVAQTYDAADLHTADLVISTIGSLDLHELSRLYNS